MNNKPKYRITWGANYTQSVSSKKAALAIAAELLMQYVTVSISVIKSPLK